MNKCEIPQDDIPGTPEEAFTDGKVIIVLGTPPDEDSDPYCELHNCDQMGCGWSHVLARIKAEGHNS